MSRWRSNHGVWLFWPPKPELLIEVIGGSYISASPHITYRRLFDNLIQNNVAIHAWAYIPSLDHQSLANEAWKNFRKCRTLLIERNRKELDVLRLGHSLGSKLHLLSPDNGRNCNGLISVSFNNFGIEDSIPIITKIAPKLRITSQFSPSPKQTLKTIAEKYCQNNNLLISFKGDTLDQHNELISCLRSRRDDNSRIIQLIGDHLTPASAGVREKFLGEWADDEIKVLSIRKLAKLILRWSKEIEG